MIDDLPHLIKLQEFDNAVDELNEKAAAFNPQIQAKNQALESLKTNLKIGKEKLSSNALKKKQLEGEIDAKEKQIQKHNGELNSLKSNDAYKAMLAEIQTAKEEIVKFEDQVLGVMESIEQDDKAYKALEQKFKSDEGAMKNEIQQLEAQKNAAMGEAEKKRAERDAYAGTCPPALVHQYDVIRERGGGVAIVPMVNNSCSGCRMSLTQSKMIEIKKAKAMVLCDSCSRILYLPKTDAPAATPPAAPAASAPQS